MCPCRWWRREGHLLSPTEHLEPAMRLIGLRLLVDQFGIEHGAQLLFERFPPGRMR
jgi:hypothetical protein